jgi:hypothetical protein
MFQLTEEERLRCQIGISKAGRGGRRSSLSETRSDPFGRRTARFSDSAHAACGALRRASFIHPDPNQRSNFIVSLRLRDRHGPRPRNGSSQEMVCCCDSTPRQCVQAARRSYR